MVRLMGCCGYYQQTIVQEGINHSGFLVDVLEQVLKDLNDANDLVLISW